MVKGEQIENEKGELKQSEKQNENEVKTERERSRSLRSRFLSRSVFVARRGIEPLLPE